MSTEYARPRAKTHFEVVRTVCAVVQLLLTVAIAFRVYG